MLTFSQMAALDGIKLYPKQIEALDACSNGWPTSLVACNGAGKTAIVAREAVKGFFKRHPKGKLVATSGSFNQLQNQLWPAIGTGMPKGVVVLNGTSPCSIRTPEGGKGIGFSTIKPERAEGWHPTIDVETDPVFILVDEGKGVPDAIFAAFDRCTVKYCLYISSPGQSTGRFFDTHHSLKRFYYAVTMSSYDCPHISASKRERDKEIHGEDSPIFRSMHLAEFTDLDSNAILSLGVLRNAIDNPPFLQTKGEKVAFFDFAAGGDENVFALREGNSVRIVEAWRDKNTVQAVRKFISLARDLGLNASQCWGDGDGLGAPMVSQFHDEHFYINSFRGNMAPSPVEDDTPKLYSNMISEVWILGCKKIAKGLVVVGELDPVTQRQLTTRFLQWDSKGCLRAEPKPEMVIRGVKSPDRADALLGAIMCGSHMTGAITAETVGNMHMDSSDFDDGGGVEF